jgi:hypothetical protein
MSWLPAPGHYLEHQVGAESHNCDLNPAGTWRQVAAAWNEEMRLDKGQHMMSNHSFANMSLDTFSASDSPGLNATM